MTTIHPLSSPASADVRPRRTPGPLLALVATGAGVGAWLLLSGPQRGVGLGGACLLAGAWLLGKKLREYAGLALVVVGGLLAGVSLLWLLVIAPVIDQAEQRLHDLTHPSISVPSVDVGGAAKSAVDRARDAAAGARDAATGLTGGKP